MKTKTSVKSGRQKLESQPIDRRYESAVQCESPSLIGLMTSELLQEQANYGQEN